MIPRIFWSKLMLLCYRTMVLVQLLLSIPNVVKASECCSSLPMVEDLILRGDYERAIDHLVELEFNSREPQIRSAAAILSARLYDRSGKQDTALRLLERLLSRDSATMTPETETLIRREQARLMLVREEILPAQRLATAARLSLGEIRQKEVLYDPPLSSSPLVSGIASAVVPGLGQTLQGRPQDTLTAWMMIGLPLIFAVQARESGEHLFANAMGIVSGFFYLGNVASSYQIAKRAVDQERTRRWLQQVDNIAPPAFAVAVQSLGLSIQVTQVLAP